MLDQSYNLNLFFFQEIVLLNPCFMFSKGLILSFNISHIIQFFDLGKSSSISHLINGKSKDLQNLLKYFNVATTSVSNVLPGVLPIIFVLYPKDLLVVVLNNKTTKTHN